MKKFILMSLFLVTCLSYTCNAQTLPDVVAVTKPNVNIRKAPNASASVIMKAPLGTIFELVSKQAGWYEVKEAYTGNKGYIATSVSKLCLKDNQAYYPGTADIVGLEENAGYENVTKKQNSETTSTYKFWFKDQGSDVVYTSLSTTSADTSGRMRSYENYYKGKQMGWYLLLNEETDYEGTVQNKMDNPILVFKSANGTSGVYVQGVYYKEAGNPFE